MVHARHVLFDAVAVTSSVVYSNSIQFANTNPAFGTPIEIDIMVNTVFAGGTNLTFALQDSADDSTYADVIITRAFTLATPAELTKSLTKPLVRFSVPTIEPTPVKKYLRIRATPTGTFTTGKLDAWIREIEQ